MTTSKRGKRSANGEHQTRTSNTYQDCANLLCDKLPEIAKRKDAYKHISRDGLVDEAIAVFAAATYIGIDLLREIAMRYNAANPSQAILAKAAREAEKLAASQGSAPDAPVLTPESQPMTLGNTPSADNVPKRQTRKKGGA